MPVKADYGLDAPSVVRNSAVIGVVCLIIGLFLCLKAVPVRPIAGGIFALAGFLLGIAMLAAAGLMVWSSKYGKLLERELMIDTLELAGHEKVLDIGCGRGLLLNGMARRLHGGRAFGIDLWQENDLSGNRLEATLANAEAEGVADRVEIKTADMRELPFPDLTMDVVVSSLAIHNISDAEGRQRAIREMVRVLKPKGRLVLQDIRFTDEYAKIIRDLGCKDVTVSRLNFLIFPPIRIVSATKP